MNPSLTTGTDGTTEVRRWIRQGWEEAATEYAQDRLGIFERSGKHLLELLRPLPGSQLLMGPFPIMLQQQLTDTQQRELERRFASSLHDLMTDRGIRCTFHLLYALTEKGR